MGADLRARGSGAGTSPDPGCAASTEHIALLEDPARHLDHAQILAAGGALDAGEGLRFRDA